MRASLCSLRLDLDSFHPFPDPQEYHVFVDGSCWQPGVQQLRLAAWAMLIAVPGFFGDPLPLADGLVPGLLQSAFRAELCVMISAMLFCVRVQRKVWIWSDCLGVVRRVRRFLEGSWVPGESTRHSDLWKIMLPHKETLSRLVCVCKVTSHLEPELEASIGDEWCAFYNNLVDKAASNAQHSRGEAFWQTWSTLCRERERASFVATEVVALHERVGHLATRSRVPRADVLLQPLPTPDWTGALGSLTDGDARFLARKYGQDYIQAITEWSTMLNVEGAPVRWISSVQLFFSFCLRFMRPPIFRGNRWQDLQSLRNGALVQISTAVWVHYFLRHLREFAKKGGGHWRFQELSV